MRKLGNLIVNEYIKILLKLSTIIMLIVVVLVAVGYNGLRLFQNWELQKFSGEYYYGSYDEQISWAKSDKEEGWEIWVDTLTYLKENDITQNYQDDDYWIQSAAYTMFEQRSKAKELLEVGETEQAEKSQKMADDLENAIKNKDWKAYNKINVDVLEAAVNNFNAEESTHFSESKEDLESSLWVAEYQLNHDIPPFYSDWKYQLLNEIQYNKSELINLKKAEPGEQDQKKIADIEEAVLIGEYQLDHDIEVSTNKNSGVLSDDSGYGELRFWDVFTSSAIGINIISLLIIIIAGSVISSEFSTGTIKYLLVNPVKRYKIFLAKYISVLSFAFLMLIIYYILNMLLAGFLFGFENFTAPYLYLSGDKIVAGSSFLFVASKYLMSSIGMICMATFAFAISSVARSSALSIGLGVFLYLSGYGAVTVMSQLNLDFGRYIIFSNLELNAIMEGVSIYKGQTLSFALIVIGVYMLVFLLTAWDGFVRKDIK